MPHKQKIPVEEKVKIVKDCLSNRISISDAARKTGADYETLRSWIRTYENEEVEGFLRKGNRAYSAEVKMAAVVD